MRAYRGCVLSRRIVDGDEVSASDLASALWFIDMRLIPKGVSEDLTLEDRHEAVAKVFAADMKKARESILPLAADLLSSYGLSPGRRNPRKGYMAAIRKKIALKYKLTDRLLRELAG